MPATDENIIKRIMPHSDEAEMAVIGSMIMNADAIDVAAQYISSEDFYNKHYRVFFEAIIELKNSQIAVNIVTLLDKLKEKGLPSEFCSTEFVTKLITEIPTSAYIKNYAEIVAKKSTLRKLIKLNEDIANKCYSEQEDVEQILNDAEKKILETAQKRNSDEITPVRKIVMNVMDGIEAAAKNDGVVTGVPTGFVDLDYRTAGMQPADLVLIAARPSMGKTAFALNIAQHVAVKLSKPTVIFSLEMTKEQLIRRMLSMEAGIDAQKLRTGQLSDQDWERLIESAGIVGNSKLIIEGNPGITVAELRSKCRKIQMEYGLSMIIIDYLQLMSGTGKPGESRQQEVSDISRSLKGVARELNVPVLALSQLSRAVEQRPDHRPMLSDLRESGAIEQDADVVMFIYRDDYYHPDTEKKGISEINVAKQRNGPIGTVELVWLPEYTRFANLEKK